MPEYSKHSKEQLATCHEKLQLIFNYIIQFYDIKISEGYRGKELQNYYYSCNPQRSKVQYPNSKHNLKPSYAVDVDPYPIDFEDKERYYVLAGMVKAVAYMHEIEIRWGGDWDRDDDLHDQSFNDLCHFEVVE